MNHHNEKGLHLSDLPGDIHWQIRSTVIAKARKVFYRGHFINVLRYDIMLKIAYIKDKS